MAVVAPPRDAITAAWPELVSVAGPIASGGQKCVFRAELCGHDVALKLVQLTSENPDDDDGFGEEIGPAIARLEREMRILQDCTSPHLARLVDWGPQVLQHEGRHFLAYAEGFIEGEPLTNVAPLPMHQALRMVVEVCDGLHAIHAHPSRYVHRDVKPGNIMCGEHFVLVDPGIAFAPDEESITGIGCRPPGTLGYMSPEQCEYFRRSVDLGPRCDIFSLGLTLVFAITGHHAYARYPNLGRSRGRLQQQAINAGRWRPEYAHSMPEEAVRLAARMIGYWPHERFSSVVEVQQQARVTLSEVSDANG